MGKPNESIAARNMSATFHSSDVRPVHPRTPGELFSRNPLLLAKGAQPTADPDSNLILQLLLGRTALEVRVPRCQVMQHKVPGDLERIPRSLLDHERGAPPLNQRAQNFRPIVLGEQGSGKSVHPSVTKGDKKLLSRGVVNAIPQRFKPCHGSVTHDLDLNPDETGFLQGPPELPGQWKVVHRSLVGKIKPTNLPAFLVKDVNVRRRVIAYVPPELETTTSYPAHRGISPPITSA